MSTSDQSGCARTPCVTRTVTGAAIAAPGLLARERAEHREQPVEAAPDPDHLLAATIEPCAVLLLLRSSGATWISAPVASASSPSAARRAGLGQLAKPPGDLALR